jgi:hypothetical protein
MTAELFRKRMISLIFRLDWTCSLVSLTALNALTALALYISMLGRYLFALVAWAL